MPLVGAPAAAAPSGMSYLSKMINKNNYNPNSLTTRHAAVDFKRDLKSPSEMMNKNKKHDKIHKKQTFLTVGAPRL